MKLSDPLAVDASTWPCAADRRGLLLAVAELNAFDRLVIDDDDEADDHGLLPVDGIRARTVSMMK